MLATGQKVINDNLNQLSWHDTAIHSILFPDENKIIIDIDYIQQWISPSNDEIYYRFLLSPATLKFEDISSFRLDIDAFNGQLMSLDKFELTQNEFDLWQCNLICHYGEIEITAKEVSFVIRGNPIPSEQQRLSSSERGYSVSNKGK